MLACGWVSLAGAEPDREAVVLLHGLARTPSSMHRMERALRAAGYRVYNMGYPSTEKPIAQIVAEDIAPRLAAIHAAETGAVHFVTHSMGGIILRQYFATHPVAAGSRLVMLGPPNRGSEIVDKLGHWTAYDWLHGPAGQQLGTASDGLVRQLPAPAMELGVIAGNRSINLFLSTLIPGPDDGKVAVWRTQLPGMRDFIVVPVAHPFLMRDPRVIDLTIRFLQEGRFTDPPDETGAPAIPDGYRSSTRK